MSSNSDNGILKTEDKSAVRDVPAQTGSLGWSDRQSNAELSSCPVTFLSLQPPALEPYTGRQCRSIGVRMIIMIVAIIGNINLEGLCYKMQVQVPNMTETLEFGAEKRLLQGHMRRKSGSCPPNPELPKEFQQSIFKGQVREERG